MPLPWRSTWVRARAKYCAACWKGCAGCGAPRRSGWRARVGFRRRAAGSGKHRCAGCMRGWGSPLLRLQPPGRRRYEGLVQPIATPASKGARVRDWRLVSLDGSCLEVADTAANRSEFGVPGASRGASAFPQLRFAALVENGTHVLFGARLGPYATGEITLAREVLAALRPGMLCLADRQFFGHELWRLALDTGADLLWRVKHNLRLPRETVLADGSYLTMVYPSDKDRRHRTGGVRVRVVEYRLKGVAGVEPLYRLVTTILDPAKAPAAELAALYHERWEIEGALAELKTHLRGAQVVLRSKTPEL